MGRPQPLIRSLALRRTGLRVSATGSGRLAGRSPEKVWLWPACRVTSAVSTLASGSRRSGNSVRSLTNEDAETRTEKPEPVRSAATSTASACAGQRQAAGPRRSTSRRHRRTRPRRPGTPRSVRTVASTSSSIMIVVAARGSSAKETCCEASGSAPPRVRRRLIVIRPLPRSRRVVVQQQRRPFGRPRPVGAGWSGTGQRRRRGGRTTEVCGCRAPSTAAQEITGQLSLSCHTTVPRLSG